MSVRPGSPDHAINIEPQAVRSALGSATSLDDLVERLIADDQLLQALGWREWHTLDGVVPTFTSDVIDLVGDDWEVLAADARRVLVQYLNERWRWRLVLIDR